MAGGSSSSIVSVSAQSAAREVAEHLAQRGGVDLLAHADGRASITLCAVAMPGRRRDSP